MASQSNEEMIMRYTTNARAILSTFDKGEKEMINTLWAYLENGLLSKEEFIEVMIEVRSWAYDDGFMAGADYANRAA
jgi:hypothetical protein